MIKAGNSNEFLLANAKRLTIFFLIALLAVVRFCFRSLMSLIALSVFVLAICACLQKVGAISTPYIAEYLDKISIEASVTVIGILIAVFSAGKAWRAQKRDELALASLSEIEQFFESSLKLIGEVNGYIILLRKLQIELKNGPYSLDTFWNAKSLQSRSKEIDDKLRHFRSFGVSVYSLDARNLHVLSSRFMIFKSFKAAKARLLELVGVSFFVVPTIGDDVESFINYLRYLPDDEYGTFLDKFDALNEGAAGGVGGIRGAIQAQYFPPTLTLARAVWRSSDEE